MNNKILSLAAASQVRCREGVLSATVEDDLVLMSIERGSYFSCNGPAGDVWRLIAEPIQIDALLAQLAEIYEGNPIEMKQDVCRLLSEMAAHGLVELE